MFEVYSTIPIGAEFCGPTIMRRFCCAMNKAPPQPSLIVAKPAPVIDTAIAGCVAIHERHIPAGLWAPTGVCPCCHVGRVLTDSSASITASTNCDYLRLPLNVSDRATSLSSPFMIKKVKVHQHMPGTLRKADSAAGRPQLHVQAPSNAAAIPAHPLRALPSSPSLRHAGTQSPAPQLAHQWWPQQWL